MFSLNIAAEQAAPAWVPAVALAIPIVIPAKRIGPAWKVPYGLGRSTTPAYPDS